MSSRVRVIALLVAVVLGLGGTIAFATQGSGGGSDDAPTDSASASTEPDLSGLPDVVATVDGVKITKTQFVQSYTAQFQLASQQSPGQPVDQDALKKQVAENLVDTQLLIAAAEARDYTVTAKDVDAALKELAEQNQQDTAGLLKALADQGLDEKEVDEQLEQQVRIDRLVAEEAGDTTPSDADLKKVYDQVVAQQGEGADVPPFEDVKAQLVEQGKQEKENAAAQNLVAELKKTATIDIAV